MSERLAAEVGRPTIKDLISGPSSGLIRKKGPYGRSPDGRAFREAATNGPVSMHSYDDATGRTRITAAQDVEPIIKANERDYNSGHDGYSPSRELRKVASIPNIEVCRLYQKGINILQDDDWQRVVHMLDSNEWLKYRTAPGKLSNRPWRHYPQVKEGFDKRKNSKTFLRKLVGS